MRFCIEAIIYLHIFRAFEEFTPSYMNEWAPNKLIRKLAKLESLFQGETKIEFKLSKNINEPNVPWTKFGAQKLPTFSWLDKNYNKLGNALHACQPHKATEYGSDLRPAFDLNNIIEDLTSFSESNLVLTFAQYIKHKCKACNEYTLLTKYFLSKNTHFNCDNPKCSTRHEITKINEKEFSLMICDIDDFKCPKCDSINLLPQSKIDIGYEFKCKCGQIYKFILALTESNDS